MIITKSVSRFARNTVTLLETIRKLKMLEVDVYFEEQNIHSISNDGCIFTITKDIAELEDGTTARRDVLHHPGGVGVIPVTDENEVLLVKQFRYPFSEITTEIPAGKLDYGESHSECGKRELLEETGCTYSEYTYLGEIYPVPAYDTEIIHIYMARGLEHQKQNLDEGEFLDVIKIPLSKAAEMVMNNEIKDAKSKIAILMAARILRI